MKIIKLNSFTIFLIGILIGAFAFFIPVMLIESAWNMSVGVTYPDFTINAWQALILWLISLLLFHLAGFLKFDLAIEKIEGLDAEKIKEKLEGIKSTKEAKAELEKTDSKIESK